MVRDAQRQSTAAETPKHSPKDDRDQWLCTKQAAAYLRVCTSFLEKRRQKKQPHLMRQGPPFYKIGGKVLYKKHDLGLWREANRHNPEGGRNV